MKTNWTNEEVITLLDELKMSCEEHKETYNSGEEKILYYILNDNIIEQFKRDNGLLSTYEIGKWNKSPSGRIGFITSEKRGDLYGYGFNPDGKWFNVTKESDEYYCAFNSVAKEKIKPATNNEVSEAFRKAGFVKDAKVKCLSSKKDRILSGELIFVKGGGLWATTKSFININIMDNGKLAEIITEEKQETTFESLKAEAIKRGVWEVPIIDCLGVERSDPQGPIHLSPALEEDILFCSFGRVYDLKTGKWATPLEAREEPRYTADEWIEFVKGITSNRQ